MTRERTWRFNAIQCQETVDGETTTFAWITDLKVDAHTVDDIATKGGRHRWQIENQGFNRQKNSGFDLENVFSNDPENLKAYHYLLQIVLNVIMQLVEVGSLLRHLAAELGCTTMQLFGSLKNLARRMLEAFRYMSLSYQAFDSLHAARIQIRIDSTQSQPSGFRVSRYQLQENRPPGARHPPRGPSWCAHNGRAGPGVGRVGPSAGPPGRILTRRILPGPLFARSVAEATWLW